MKNTGRINGKRIFLIIISLAILVICANRVRLHYARTAVEQARIAYDQKDYDLAISNYSRAIKMGYEKDSNLLWRGRAYYYGKRDFDMAIADFTKAIELRPDYYVYYMWRGRAYRQKMEYDSAIADFSKAINIDSNSSYGGHDKFVERGNVYADKGDYALAILDYDRAIAEIDAMVARRLQLHIEDPGFGWDNNTELYQWRDEALAQRSYVERKLNNSGWEESSISNEIIRQITEAFRNIFEGED